MKKYYITLYDYFSVKGHGNDAMSGWEPCSLKNPKVPNMKAVANNIDLTLTFITGIAADILKSEFPPEYYRYAKKHLELRKKIADLSEELRNVSFKEE